MSQKLFEFGGRAKVFLKAICNFDDYKKNDVVACFDDVEVTFSFVNKESKINKSVSNLVSYNLKDISEVELSSLGITEELMRLLHLNNNNVFEITQKQEWSILDNDEDTCYLLNIPSNPKEIQIVPKVPFHYYENTNSLTLDNKDKNVDLYHIYYNTEKKGISYSLKQETNIPYLKMEIYFFGNINKNMGNASLILPTVNLIDKMNINVTDESVSDISLSFTVIKNEKDNTFLIW